MELIKLFKQAQDSRLEIGMLSTEKKNEIIRFIYLLLIENIQKIIYENQKDLDLISDDNPKKDRLLLNEIRIQNIAESCEKIILLDDPSQKIIINKMLNNGLNLQKITVPIGIVGVIYESRPNVTIDVSILNIKTGNTTILRGSKDAYYTNLILVSIIQEALIKAGVDKNCVQLMPTDRDLVYELLQAKEYVDVIIPRGSQSLINFVRENAKVPIIETGAGVCHTYIEKTAIPSMAAEIIENAKTQRSSVCNALDSIIIDKEISTKVLPKISKRLMESKVEIFADDYSYSILKDLNYPFLFRAVEENFGKEYLSLKCSIKTVMDFNQAIQHINKYSSKHSECIITENIELAEKFIQIVDAAAVYHNASTRFTDGEEFGLGAEIGISTQKLHARGPFALEKLVTEKWVIRGQGQIRN